MKLFIHATIENSTIYRINDDVKAEEVDKILLDLKNEILEHLKTE